MVLAVTMALVYTGSVGSMPDSIDLPGQRIIIVGSSCAGKSTLGARLAEALDAPFVELDALFWLPNWTETPDDEFAAKIAAATAGERWVVAGNYHRHTLPTIWRRADTIVWLDFPLPLVLSRIVRRSWRRHRSGELLWGTNYEPFWSQFLVWQEGSLIGFTLKSHRRRRRFYQEAMASGRWRHIRFVRLTRRRDVDRFAAETEQAARRRPAESVGMEGVSAP